MKPPVSSSLLKKPVSETDFLVVIPASRFASPGFMQLLLHHELALRISRYRTGVARKGEVLAYA
jgi:hypothetical protein